MQKINIGCRNLTDIGLTIPDATTGGRPKPVYFFNPVGADQNTPPDDPEILQLGREELNQKIRLD